MVLNQIGELLPQNMPFQIPAGSNRFLWFPLFGLASLKPSRMYAITAGEEQDGSRQDKDGVGQ